MFVRIADATQEIEIKGTRKEFRDLAELVSTGGTIETLTEAALAPPYHRMLKGIVVIRGAGGGTVRIAPESTDYLEINGGELKQKILLDNFLGLANEGASHEHAHLEYFPNHFFLSSDSWPVVITLLD